MLLPVAAYAVDATVVASRAAGLPGATARQPGGGAAVGREVSPLRGRAALDATTVRLAVSETLAAEEPGASVDLLNIKGLEVTVVTRESVTLPFSVFTGTIQLHARAIARLAPGYDNPS